jgi:spermidine synthase
VGGIMTFAWATDDVTMRFIDRKLLEDRYAESQITTRYYTPAIHRASFALPGYVLEAIGK